MLGLTCWWDASIVLQWRLEVSLCICDRPPGSTTVIFCVALAWYTRVCLCLGLCPHRSTVLSSFFFSLFPTYLFDHEIRICIARIVTETSGMIRIVDLQTEE